MSESEALVSFAAAKLGASRPKCVLVTVAYFYPGRGVEGVRYSPL
jgi:hypothetical protein